MIDDLETRWPRTKGRVTAASMRERYGHAYTPSRNEGFFAKRVILVEGATESYSLPIYAKACGIEFDELAIAVIECGNKDGIERLYRVFNELGIAAYIVFDFDHGNIDQQRIKESKALLAVAGEEEIDVPTGDFVGTNCAYFKTTFEEYARTQVDDYEALTMEARKTLGLRNESKPLEARFIARKLAEREPPQVPDVLRRIVEAAVAVEYSGSCLKKSVEDAEPGPESGS